MKIYITLFALIITATINAQNPGTKTIFTENFGFLDTNESISANSSIYSHTGTGDFIHKIVNSQGASGSKCFGQLNTGGLATAYFDVQFEANETYEFSANVKTDQSRLFTTLRINIGGIDVDSSGYTSANGVWDTLYCSYTPTQNVTATLKFVKKAGYRANIDKIKVICTSCADKNLVFDFNDSKEGWINGGGCNLFIGNDGFLMKATGPTVAVARSGNLNSNLNLSTSYYNSARITFKTPYPSHQAGNGKLFFHSLAGGNAPFATFNFPRDPSNTSTYQTVEIDLDSTTYAGDIARLGFRAPWGINKNGRTGDSCYWQKLELFNKILEADFSTSVSIFCLGTTVNFTDLSTTTTTPTSWAWDFGDGNTSSSQNPTHIYTSAGVYDVALTIIDGTNSYTETKTNFITVNDLPVVSAGVDQTICSGSNVTLSGSGANTYVWNNGVNNGLAFIPSSTTTYLVTGTDVNNCSYSDSVVVSLNQHTTEINVISSCDSYTWLDGNTYTTNNNVATFTLPNAAGCDSIISLNLTINQSSSSFLSITSCSSYDWNLTNYTNSGLYIDTLTNNVGCLQIDTLDLTISNLGSSITQIACDSFAWNSINYSTSGTYYSTSSSCTDTLFLTVNNSSIGTDSQTACDSFTWIDGRLYTSNNDTATFLIQTANGCDSLVTLDLIINNGSSETIPVTECNSYVWDGMTYDSTGNYTNFYTDANSCDSVVTLDLTINTASATIDTTIGGDLIANGGSSYLWNTGNVTLEATVNGAAGEVAINMVEAVEINGEGDKVRLHYFTSKPWWKDFYQAETQTKEFLVKNALFFKSTDIIQKEN